MAYDEKLAERVRGALKDEQHVQEKKMFGGVGFLVRDHMACGVLGDGLIVRVGPERYEEALAQPHVGEFDVTGRAMTGWVKVDRQGIAAEGSLSRWVRLGLAFARALPPK